MKRIHYNSPVVLSFALLSLVALLLDTITGGWTTKHLFCVYRCSLMDPLAYVRFFGHVLGHSNWSHYASNMLLFLLIGPPLEEKYGSKTILGFIAVTALATGLVEFFLIPGAALLGASGVMFMMIMLSSFTQNRQGTIPLTFVLVLILYLGNELITGISSADNISQLTHIVGGLCGMFFGFSYGKAGRK